MRRAQFKSALEREHLASMAPVVSSQAAFGSSVKYAVRSLVTVGQFLLCARDVHIARAGPSEGTDPPRQHNGAHTP